MSADDRMPILFANTNADEQNGQFSPDSQWIAYQSDETDRSEIYMEPFPGPGRRELVSPDGGTQPRWNSNGNELFYIDLEGTLMAVPIDITGRSLKIGIPESLFPSGIPRGGYMDIFGIQYAVSGDGQRFLINRTIGESSPAPITIVTHWTNLLD